MAAREADIALWLHNKLGSTDDLWSGSSICSQLSRDKLVLIQDCFHNLQPHVKVKLLLSFVHIPKRNVEEWKHELDDLIQMAQDDTDQWVTMVAEMLKDYPNGGALNTDIADHQNSFHDIVNDLRKIVRRTLDSRMAPLECSYLSRSAQVSVTGQIQPHIKHFALKRKPKSAALRAELLQKSVEAANNLKKNKNKNSGFTVPVKIRSFAKKLDDSTPMKGIPNNHPSSGGGGFLRSNSLGSRFGGSTPLGQRSHASQREGGIKLLNIDECPVGAKEAKRRRKQQELELQEQAKKEKEAQANTPDYAAGLVNPAGLGGVEVSAGPSYVPAGSVTGAGSAGTLPGAGVSAARDQLQHQLNQQLASSVPPVPTSTPSSSSLSLATSSSSNTVHTLVTLGNPVNNRQAGTITVVTAQPGSTTHTVIAPTSAQTLPVTGGATLNTATLQPANANATILPNAPVMQGTVTSPTATTPNVAAPNTPNTPTVGQQPAQPVKKGLSLTREQMFAAQEMFRTSNRVTRPEKALILGFMAGSRENPCKAQGDIVNIRLGEEHDSIQQPDGTFKPMMVENFIQMNYATGDWKKIKKVRDLDNE